jgi:hypothetical protein
MNLFDILQKTLFASKDNLDIEEIVFLLILVVMGVITLSFIIIFIVHWKLFKLFIRKMVLCIIISILFIIVFFCGALVEDFPQSTVAWEDILDSLLRVFILLIWISCFVAVMWTFLYIKLSDSGAFVQKP